MRQIKVNEPFSAICHICMWGSVMKISIRIIPKNSIRKMTRLVAFFRTNLVGGLNIRQSSAPGLLNIRVTSLAKS
jgi:hypothetical protein